MLAVHCPDVPTPSGLTLLPVSRIVSLTERDGHTVALLACYSGHLHAVVDGRAVRETPAAPVAA